tara:strand:+ start:281 stop:523 length:243 start_codon:yes stop_codon:yes gene_type:complete
MEEKNKTERLEKKDLIKTIRIVHQMHEQIVQLQEAYMQEQTALFHEKWKVRHLTRVLKQVAPEQVLSEEELDAKIHGKEH